MNKYNCGDVFTYFTNLKYLTLCSDSCSSNMLTSFKNCNSLHTFEFRYNCSDVEMTFNKPKNLKYFKINDVIIRY